MFKPRSNAFMFSVMGVVHLIAGLAMAVHSQFDPAALNPDLIVSQTLGGLLMLLIALFIVSTEVQP